MLLFRQVVNTEAASSSVERHETRPATNTDLQQQSTAQQALFKAEERAKIMLKGTKKRKLGKNR